MTPDPIRLLLVDDDPMPRALLRRFLSTRGFDISEAADGAAALELAGAQTFDLILLDVDMPGMGGLEVLRALRAKHDPALLPVVMATVKDHSSDIVGALEAGANDYVTKPFDLPVVLARARAQHALKLAIDRARHLEQSLAQRNAELEQANRKMRQELEAAARVQGALLPYSPPQLPGIGFAWHYRPCAELAGDLLGLAPTDRHVWLYVLDVVDHGVKAALLAVMINRVLSRLLGDPTATPSSVAAHLDREFPWDGRTQQYFSLLLGTLDAAAGEFRFISAGQPGPIHLPRGGPPRLLRHSGSLIGLGDDGWDEQVLKVGVGDRLYLYTDGLTEAMRQGGGQIGDARCAAVLDGARGLPLADSLVELHRAIEAWTSPRPPHDDISVVAAELLPT